MEEQRYRQRHPDRVRATYQRWAEANRERTRAYQRKYRAADPEKFRERDRARGQTAERKAYQAAYTKAWRAANAEKKRAAWREWCLQHPEQRREKRRENEQRRRARKRGVASALVSMREVFDRCRGRCHICGGTVKWSTEYPDPRSKTIDHLVPLARGGGHEPTNVSLAHLRCNVRRHLGNDPTQLWLLAG